MMNYIFQELPAQVKPEDILQVLPSYFQDPFNALQEPGYLLDRLIVESNERLEKQQIMEEAQSKAQTQYQKEQLEQTKVTLQKEEQVIPTIPETQQEQLNTLEQEGQRLIQEVRSFLEDFQQQADFPDSIQEEIDTQSQQLEQEHPEMKQSLQNHQITTQQYVMMSYVFAHP